MDINTVISYIIFISILFLHTVFIISFILLPTYNYLCIPIIRKLFNIVIKQQKSHIYDFIFRLFFTLFIGYVICKVNNLITYGINDYIQDIIYFSYINNDIYRIIIFMIILNFDLINLIFILIINYKNTNFICNKSQINDISITQEEYEIEKQNCFIITCYNSSSNIETTLKSLLVKIPNTNIFVADNGSKDNDITEKICKFYKINYMYFTVANKTKAQFTIANIVRINNSHITHITLIDDDTDLPINWSFNHVKEHFTDKDVICLAFPLQVKNKINFITECQNLEYLLSSYAKIGQTKISSILFSSGCFTVWNFDFFLDIIVRHNTVFHGDDFQLGMLCNKLYKQKSLTSTKIYNNNLKIILCSHIFVSTNVPIHRYHNTDIPLLGNLFKSCSCNTKSLYYQRARSWDLIHNRFLFNYIDIIFTKNKLCWNSIWIKFLYIIEVFNVLNDWLGILYIFIFGFIYGYWNNLFKSLILSMCWTIPLLIIINIFVLKKHKISLTVILLYNIFYKFIMNTIIRIDGLIYNFLLYSTIKQPKILYKQIQNIYNFYYYLQYWKQYTNKISITSPTNTNKSYKSLYSTISLYSTPKPVKINGEIKFTEEVLPNYIYDNLEIKIEE